MLTDKEYELILLEIGVKIGYYRRKRGMTQEELAEYADISLSHLSQLESPNLPYAPSVKSLFKLANALGVSASKLIEIDD